MWDFFIFLGGRDVFLRQSRRYLSGPENDLFQYYCHQFSFYPNKYATWSYDIEFELMKLTYAYPRSSFTDGINSHSFAYGGNNTYA